MCYIWYTRYLFTRLRENVCDVRKSITLIPGPITCPCVQNVKKVRGCKFIARRSFWKPRAVHFVNYEGWIVEFATCPTPDGRPSEIGQSSAVLIEKATPTEIDTSFLPIFSAAEQRLTKVSENVGTVVTLSHVYGVNIIRDNTIWVT